MSELMYKHALCLAIMSENFPQNSHDEVQKFT